MGSTSVRKYYTDVLFILLNYFEELPSTSLTNLAELHLYYFSKDQIELKKMPSTYGTLYEKSKLVHYTAL